MPFYYEKRKVNSATEYLAAVRSGHVQITFPREYDRILLSLLEKEIKDAAGQPEPLVLCEYARRIGMGRGCFQPQVGRAVEILERLAKDNFAPAIYTLGFFCERTRQQSDAEKARRYYLSAAQMGYAPACDKVGLQYLNGTGVERSVEEFLKWCTKAAEAGLALAQLRLSFEYMSGANLPRNTALGVTWLQRAADQGMPEAQWRMGACYWEAYCVQKSVYKGAKLICAAKDQDLREPAFLQGEWPKRCRQAPGLEDMTDAQLQMLDAALTDDAAAKLQLGESLLDDPETAQAGYTWCAAAAELGLPAAWCRLGICHEEGIGVERRDSALAAEHYTKAAAGKHKEGAYRLGLCYERGKGVAASPAEALRCYQIAAEAGHKEAAARVQELEKQQAMEKTKEAARLYGQGQAYANGTSSVEPDIQKAFECFLAAAELGHVRAQFRVAECYVAGEGTAIDWPAAVKWHTAAANGGWAESKYWLAEAYLNGLFCLEKQEKVAVNWLESCELPEAKALLGECYGKGWGVAQSFERAIALYEAAMAAAASDMERTPYKKRLAELRAEQEQANRPKDPEELYRQANNYRYGKNGTKMDINAAAEHLRLAADLGHARAQFDLAVFYAQGRGVAKDAEQALKWYQKAAENGLAEAQRELGDAYRAGRWSLKRDGRSAVHWYEKAAAQKDELSLFALGQLYYEGEIVARSFEKAVAWLEKCSWHKAKALLGECYAKGQGVRLSLDKAVALYEEAARAALLSADKKAHEKRLAELRAERDAAQQAAPAKSEAEEIFQKGENYYYGLNGTARSYERAAQQYRRAAEMGFAKAQHQLAECYDWGRGVAKDAAAALQWHRKAAEGGYDKSQRWLGSAYLNGWNGLKPDGKTAVHWYEKAAAQQNVLAMNCLAKAYYEGRGVPVSYEKAVAWLQKCEWHESKALLAECYYKGQGVERSMDKAIELYREAIAMAPFGADAYEKRLSELEDEYNGTVPAETESAEALFQKGENCFYGLNDVEEDEEAAVGYYTRAAKLGHPEAQYQLAECYDWGFGVEEDSAMAVKWYTAAAENGHVDAQRWLGNAYIEGWNDLEADGEKAVYWFGKAVEQDDNLAMYYLAECYYQGDKVPRSYEKAVELLKKTSWYKGKLLLAECYAKGHGTERDLDKAVAAAEEAERMAQSSEDKAVCNKRLRELKAEQGSAGKSAPQTPAAPAAPVVQRPASQKRAADRNWSTEENFKKARAYEYGAGVEQSLEKAYSLYKQSAKLGNPEAQYTLAEWHRKGIHVKKSCIEAVPYYIQAAEMGDERARKRLEQLRDKNFVQTVEAALKYGPVFGISQILCADGVDMGVSEVCALVSRMAEFGLSVNDEKELTKQTLLISREEWDVLKDFLMIKD